MKTIINDSVKSKYFFISKPGKYEFDIRRVKKVTFLITALFSSGEYDLKFNLRKSRASINIIGLVYAGGDNSITVRTVQNHITSNTKSKIFLKSILKEKSRFFYEGDIVVSRNAHGTDAFQKNDNLLLNENVKVKSQPNLNILTDDVKCTHAVTISTLSDAHLWYLASRGIKRHIAGKMIINGFISDLADRIDQKQAKEKYLTSIRKKVK